MRSIIAAVSVLALVAACSPPAPKAPAAIAPGPTAAAEIQKRLIEAKPGDTVELAAGQFDFTTGLSLDVANVTFKGAGQDKTILSFANQTSAGEGLLVTSDGVTRTQIEVVDKF